MAERCVVVRTERLVLSEFHADDAPGMVELNAAPDVLRFTGDAPFASVDEALRLIAEYDCYRVDGYGRWSVHRADDGAYLGWCGLRRARDTGDVDVGFRILARHRNRGYATEAARGCIGHGFGPLGLTRIIGRCAADNDASIRVLENIGMTRISPIDFDGMAGLLYEVRARP